MKENYDLLIEAFIKTLERLKGQPPSLQSNALWKIGDYIATAVEEWEICNRAGWAMNAPEADHLLEKLLAFHREVEQMMQDEVA